MYVSFFNPRSAHFGSTLVFQVPSNLSGSDSLRFNITLLFPQTTNTAAVNQLATWLPMFSQSFGRMDKQLTFNKATIEGAASNFSAAYLQANNLYVKTSLAEIKGNFRVNESLTLDTAEAYVYSVSFYCKH